MAYVVTVKFEIALGQMEAFVPLMQENASISVRDEPGCSLFDVCMDEARPNVVFLYEVYDDLAAFEQHLGSAHFTAFSSATHDMVTGKTVETYETVQLNRS